MSQTLKLSVLTALTCLGVALPARAEEEPSAAYVDDTSVVGLWEDATKTTIGETAEYTNSVELADINGDGMVGYPVRQWRRLRSPRQARVQPSIP